MRKRLGALLGTVVVSTVVLAGCGTSGSATTSGSRSSDASASVAGSPPAKVTKVMLTSTAIGASIPARYTCDGSDISPPLRWGAIPARTKELVLFAVGFEPAIVGKYSYSVAWAVSGINPALHSLPAGQLPPGAHVGVASNGKRRYSICPPKGQRERYQFELYGLPASGAVSPHFVGLTALASLVTSDKASPINAYGSLVTSYTRR